jgi:hypothetical protein
VIPWLEDCCAPSDEMRSNNVADIKNERFIVPLRQGRLLGFNYLIGLDSEHDTTKRLWCSVGGNARLRSPYRIEPACNRRRVFFCESDSDQNGTAATAEADRPAIQTYSDYREF